MDASVRQVKLYDTGATSVNSAQTIAISTFPQGNVLAGSTLIVMPTCSNFAGTIIWGANDSRNGTYTPLDITRDPGNASFNSYYRANCSSMAGTDTISWRYGPSASVDGNEDFVGVLIIEVIGITSSPLLAHAINAGTNGVQTVASTTADTITTANLVCGAVAGIVVAASYNSVQNGSAPYAPTVGTGFSSDGTSLIFGSGSTATARLEHLRSASLGTLAATFTAATATSTHFQTLAVALAEAAGGWSPVDVGTYVRGTGTLTPGLPGTWAPGQQALLFTGNRGASISTTLTISGWTQLTVPNNCFNIGLYGRELQIGDTDPSVTWSSAATQTGFAVIRTYSGGSLNIHVQADRASTNTSQLGYAATTISQAGCLVIAAGRHIKSSTSNGCTIGALAGFANVLNDVGTGNANAAAYNEWIQTTATNTSLDTQAMSIADTSSNAQGFTIALLPASVTTSTPTRSLLGVGT